MARTVEDILARRTRALFLNAAAASTMAEPVAKLLAAELGYDAAWVTAQVNDFQVLAQQYRVV
jgi:glycerol-3-phosphate dehydrogenase